MSPSSSSYCRLNTAAVCKAGGALGEATSPAEAADAAAVPGSLTFAGHVCVSLQHRTHPRSRHKQKMISPTKRRTWRWTAEKTEKSKTKAERADAPSLFLMLKYQEDTIRRLPSKLQFSKNVSSKMSTSWGSETQQFYDRLVSIRLTFGFLFSITQTLCWRYFPPPIAETQQQNGWAYLPAVWWKAPAPGAKRRAGP